MMSLTWYEEYIEEPIRPLVRLLRDNGFNTTSSCGHDMWVEMEFVDDGDLKILQELLRENEYGYFRIIVTVEEHKALHYYGRGLRVELLVNEKGERG